MRHKRPDDPKVYALGPGRVQAGVQLAGTRELKVNPLHRLPHIAEMPLDAEEGMCREFRENLACRRRRFLKTALQAKQAAAPFLKHSRLKLPSGRIPGLALLARFCQDAVLQQQTCEEDSGEHLIAALHARLSMMSRCVSSLMLICNDVCEDNLGGSCAQEM